MKRIYFDTETTGFNPPVAGIVEVAAVMVDEDGKEIDEFSSLTDPGAKIVDHPDTLKALAINKISLEEIKAAQPAEAVAKELWKFLAKHNALRDDTQFHAFNIAFDSRFLNLKPWAIPPDKWGECVMLASAKIINPFDGRWPKQIVAAHFFKVEFDGPAHRAITDTRVAARIHRKIFERRSLKASKQGKL